jgi:antitoxin ParD1/3/4
MDISLTPEIEQFIHDHIKSGRYLSASEVVREGLRLLNEREFYYQGRLAELQKEITIGVEQADRGELLDGEAVMQELMQELNCSSTAKP